jgi:hypothetical protein
MKTYWRGGGIASRIFYLGTPRLFHTRGKNPRCPLDTRLDETEIRSGRVGEENKSQPPPGIELPNLISFLDSFINFR